ncbi:aldehyde dehydrogenase family protein [Lewinellaceae bacterium SD302]|nr:aldehyde dehydrogenase family protein [Lewinellaceae bacterium SD302]
MESSKPATMSNDLTTVTVDDKVIDRLFLAQQNTATLLAKTTARQRLAKLKKIEHYLLNHEAELIAALRKDFGKHPVETLVSESAVVLTQIRHVRKHLADWMRPKRVKTPLSLTGTRSYLHYEPVGQVLIIAPWNYPVNLALYPLVYAIAAGCTVILKPSEFTPAAAGFIRNLVESVFDEKEVAIVEGDGDVAAKLTSKPFNHIFFTGSPQVGKLVMKAASQNLAGVTLELGGKSPAIIDATANLKVAAERTVWAKYFNCGQTCIAPDYLLVEEKVADDFKVAYLNAIKKLYGSDPKKSGDLARVVNEKHFNRIKDLLDKAIEDGATVAAGGQTDSKENYIAPTLVDRVTEDMDIMQEEIFGPVMPLLTFKTRQEAVAVINRRPKPLSMYINSKSREAQHYFINNTRAGSTLINEYLLSFSNPNLPMGGSNHSGLGKSLGHEGFLEFTNARSVLKRNFLDLSMLYPPYDMQKTKLAKFLYKYL